MSRSSRTLIALAVTLLFSACAARPDAGGGGVTGSGPCATGTGSADRNAPIVCVNDTGASLTVRPDPIRVHDVGQHDGLPVMLQWHTVSGGNDLRVEIEPGCVTEVRCERPGHCSGRTLPRADKTDKRCKYDVWTDKHPRLDPEVIITPCC